jgi:hypothetical protein
MKLFVAGLLLSLALTVVGLGRGPIFAQTPEDTEEPAPTQQQEEPTEAPAPTDEPAEPTEAPAATDVPVEQPTDVAGTPTEEGDGDDDDDNNTWLIIALVIAGIVVLIGLAGLLFGRRGSGGGPSPSDDWGHRASEAYGKAAALHDSIAVELASTTPLSDDPAARQRWQEVQRRIDDLSADLHVLETRPKNEQAAATLRQMFATLTALRSATLAETPTAPAEPPVAGQPSPSENLAGLIRQRLADFDGEVRAFRTLL